MASAAELLQEAEFRRCRGVSLSDVEACMHFMRTYCRIQHPEQGAILFDLREAQVEALKVCMMERDVIILKSRQIGWSTLMAVYCLWLGMFYDDQVIVMLSKTERDAHKLLAKSDYAYKRLPEWLRLRAAKRLDRNVGKITFDNGSALESLPSKEDPARGSAVSLVVVDEWAFFDNPDDAWASIEPITDVGGRCIGLSTANGWGNFYQKFWALAVAKKSKFTAIFFPWMANSDRDDDWYAAKKASMPSWQLYQEYPSTPEEAFIKSGNPVFDVDALRKVAVIAPRRFTISILENGIKSPQLHPHSEGALRLWATRTTDDAYVIGADVAEGLDYGDYSSAHVISARSGEVVAKWHGHIDPDLFGEELAKLGYYYNTAFIGVEANNHGLTTNKALQRVSYPRLYVRRRLDGKTSHRKAIDTIGWLTTRVSKPLMIDELARDVRNHTVSTSDEETIGEMLTFVRNDKGQMSGSPFDDQVISFAIANQMLSFARVQDQAEEMPYYFTFNYFMDKVLAQSGSTEEYHIGQNHVRT